MITESYTGKETYYDALKPAHDLDELNLDIDINDSLSFPEEHQNAPVILSKGKDKIVEYLQSLETESALTFCRAYKRQTINPIASEELKDFRKLYFASSFEVTDRKMKRISGSEDVFQTLSSKLGKSISLIIVHYIFDPPNLEIVFRQICTSNWFLIHDLETQSIERCLETLVEVLYETGYVSDTEKIFETLFSLLMLETQRTNTIASRKSQQLSEQSYVNMLEGYQHDDVARRMYQYVQEEGLSDKKRATSRDSSCCTGCTLS